MATEGFPSGPGIMILLILALLSGLYITDYPNGFIEVELSLQEGNYFFIESLDNMRGEAVVVRQAHIHLPAPE